MTNERDTLLTFCDTLRRPVPQLRPANDVYLHYCSLDAFYKIFESGRLRYTSAMSTNDPSEFLFGQEVLQKALEPPHPGRDNQAQTIIRLCREQSASRNFRAFVFCMSEAVDDESEVGELSQWRLYGGDGRGVALVIDARAPSGMESLTALSSIPRRVLYGADEGQAFVRELLQSFFSEAASSEKLSTETRAGRKALAGHLLNATYWLPSVIKHKAYRHEREVRLVRGDAGLDGGQPLVFFEKGGVQRPAIELQISAISEKNGRTLHKSPISGVIIGPSSNQATIYDSINYYLEALGWGVFVKRSDIPYRAI